MLLTRRNLLVAGALGAAGGCRHDDVQSAAPPDPDAALVASAVAREQALLVSYDDALATHPELAAQLAPLRAEHAQHLARLQPPATPAPSAPPTSPPTTAPPAATVDTAPERLAALAVVEQAMSTAHGADALVASRGLAPVLASLAASEASHRVVL